MAKVYFKAAFVLGENDFRKSFSPFSACLVATENTIFWKLHSCWPKFTPLTRKWIYVLIFTSIHFRVTLHAQQHREKREAKHKTNAHTAIQRASIHAQQHREKERTSSDPHFISPIHSDPRTREVRSTHSNTGRNRERASIQSDPRTRELRSKTFYLIPVCVLIKKKGLKKEEVKLEHIPCPINDLTNCHKHKVW